jgi:hypothetical protein
MISKLHHYCQRIFYLSEVLSLLTNLLYDNGVLKLRTITSNGLADKVRPHPDVSTPETNFQEKIWSTAQRNLHLLQSPNQRNRSEKVSVRLFRGASLASRRQGGGARPRTNPAPSYTQAAARDERGLASALAHSACNRHWARAHRSPSRSGRARCNARTTTRTLEPLCHPPMKIIEANVWEIQFKHDFDRILHSAGFQTPSWMSWPDRDTSELLHQSFDYIFAADERNREPFRLWVNQSLSFLRAHTVR